MAELRDKIWKQQGSEPLTLVPLDTDPSSGYSTEEIKVGAPDSRKIRVIQNKGPVSSNTLLEVVEDLVENDRRINNEKNSGHSILSDGIFNDQGANFDIELYKDEIQPNIFKGFKVLSGKVKTDKTIYQITTEIERGLKSFLPTNPTSDDNIKYSIENIEDMPNTPINSYRRDYLSLVYKDNALNSPTTPYWRYFNNEQTYINPPVKTLQKVYEEGSLGEEWPISDNKRDMNGDPAIYKEFILYSFLYQYDGRGTWINLNVSSGASFPLSPLANSYFELLEVNDESLDGGLYQYVGIEWLPIVTITNSAFPSNIEADAFYFIDGTGDLDRGYYEYQQDNKYTKLISVDLIPNYVGISNVINYVDSGLVPYEVNGEFKMYRVGYVDKRFYHPFATFTPLPIEYGQGGEVTQEGFIYNTTSNKYIQNSLMLDYKALNHIDSSLFNFPFILSDENTDNYTTLEVEHIMLGYKKEGYWNGDYIQISDSYYKMINGIWAESTPICVNSNFPVNPILNDIFEDVSANTLWEYNGTIWEQIVVDIANDIDIRKGNEYPVLPTVSPVSYFEIRNSSIPAVPNGLYKYDYDTATSRNSWGAYLYTAPAYIGIFTSLPTGVYNTSRVDFPTGTEIDPKYVGQIIHINGFGVEEEGWYLCENVNSDFVKLSVNYGDKFPGGLDLLGQERWNETPSEGELFYADGNGNPDKGWFVKKPTYWEKIDNAVLGNTKITTDIVSALDTGDVFISNGLDYENGKPIKGAYEYIKDEWEKVIYNSNTFFPLTGLKDGLHFVLTENITGFVEGLYKYVEGGFRNKTGQLYGSGSGVELPDVSTLTSADNNKYFYVTTPENKGWYKFFFISDSLPDSKFNRWNNIPAYTLSSLPVYKMTEGAYVDIAGVLYQYDEDITYWKFITNTTLTPPVDEPEFPVDEKYEFISGFNYEWEMGWYKYTSGRWVFNDITVLNDFPLSEDDIEIEIIQPKIFKNLNGESELSILTATSKDINLGKWEITVSLPLSERNRLDINQRNIAINDVILITNGTGKYQTGFITGITTEEVITIQGVYTNIDISSDLVFVSGVLADNTIKGTNVLTKIEVMSQIDIIDNTSVNLNSLVDTSINGTKINDDEYQIKIDLTNTNVLNNSWNFVRTKTKKALNSTPAWQSPKILISNQNDFSQSSRNGYLAVRYFTLKGKYPYYGLDSDGDIDLTSKYLVIEDSYEAGIEGSWNEIQTSSNNRTLSLGFDKFKVLTRNLEDYNAKSLYEELENKTVKNEVYLDVINGRILFHPDVYTLFNTVDNYVLRISFITLNTLTAELSSENISYYDYTDNSKKTLYDKIKELETTTLSNIERKIFNYRGKYANIYKTEDPKKCLTIKQTIYNGSNLNDTLYLSYTDGTPIGPNVDNIFKMYPEKPISLFCEGDTYTKELFNYNEGFFKANDYFKLLDFSNNAKWYQYTTDWSEITFTSGIVLPVGVLGDYFELLNDGLYVYTTVWVKITNLAFPSVGYVLPTKTPYEERTNTLTEQAVSIEDNVNPNSLAFSTTSGLMKSLDTIRFIGIQIKTVGTLWNNIIATVHTDSNTVKATASVSRVNVESIVNNNDIINKDKWIYFEFNDSFKPEDLINYHIHFHIDTLNGGDAPVILGYEDNVDGKLFFKLLGRGTDKTAEVRVNDPAYPDAGMFVLNSKETGTVLETSYITPVNRDGMDIIDPVSNKPLCENTDYTFVIPVDFSNQTEWEKWNFVNCIGYDPIYGRLKFPSTLNADNYAVEFNANWSNKIVNAKAVSISANLNVSLEDYYDLIDTYNNVDELIEYTDKRIARYSPTSQEFVATGIPEEPFLLDFIPQGYYLNNEGEIVYDNDEYLGSDAAKRSLFVTINGILYPSSKYTLTGKILKFTPDVTVNALDKICIRGSEYNVITTVSNKSITPDHFSEETQLFFQDLAKSMSNIEEYSTESLFPITGTSNTIYIAQDTSQLYRWDGTQYVLASGGGGTTKDIALVNHGFKVGQMLTFSNDTFELALATSKDTLGLFIVSRVADVDNFTIMQMGYLEVTESLATVLDEATVGFTPDAWYYLSETNAGNLTSTKPFLAQAVLYAISATEAYVIGYSQSSNAFHYVDEFTYSVGTSVYTLTHKVDRKDSLLVIVGGVPQSNADYEVDTYQLTFNAVYPDGVFIRVWYISATNYDPAGAAIEEYKELTTEIKNTFTLQNTPISPRHLIISINGQIIDSDNYSVSGYNVIFNDNIPAGQKVKITNIYAARLLGFTAENTPDNSIPASKIIDGSGSGLDADKLDGQHITTIKANKTGTLNFNTMSETGIYEINNANWSGWSNYPGQSQTVVATVKGVLSVENSGTFISQTYSCVDKDEIWVRKRNATTWTTWITSALYPVGSFYVQYPDAASNDDAIAFPVSARPATMFGGTWVEQFNTENVFFRTNGTNYQTRTNGLSEDQVGSHDHLINMYYGNLSLPGYVSGGENNYTGARNTNGVNSGRTGTVTEPRNRLMKLWKRTVL